MLGINLSLARRTMMRQLGWAADYDGATENLQITNPKNIYSGEYSLKADFANDVVGQAPAGWTTSSGNYKVLQWAIDNSNIIKNSNFNLDLSFWTNNGNHSTKWISNDGALNMGCMEITSTGVGDPVNGRINSLGSSLNNHLGKTIKRSFYAKSISGNNQFVVRDGMGGGFQSFTIDSEWKLYSYSYSVRNSNNYEPFIGYLLGAGVIRIDEVYVGETNPLESINHGTKFIEGINSGTIAIPCNHVVGKVRFSWYKGGTNDVFDLCFADRNSLYSNENGYNIRANNSGSLQFLKRTNGAGNALLGTATAYFNNYTWYEIEYENLSNGQKSLKIRGGAFGNNFVQVSTSITDNTFISCNYLVLDLDVGDRITNIVCEYGSGSLDLFGWERFLHSGNRDFELPVAYGLELIVNGSFNSNLNNWIPFGSDNSIWEDGRAKITGNNEGRKQSIATTPGKVYQISGKFQKGTVLGTIAAQGIVPFTRNLTSITNDPFTFLYTADAALTEIRAYTSAGLETDYCYFDEISVKEVLSDWQKVGNHDCYVTGEDKYSGAYCLKVISTGAGDSNNCIFIADDKFLTLIAGKKFCSQRRIKTSVDCTMSVQFGDKVVSRAIVAGSWTLTPWTFEATAGTVNQPCKIWFDRAVTAYIDEIGLAEHFPTTISIWFKTGATSGRSLINKSTGTAGNSYGYNIRQNLSDKLTVPIFDGSGNIASITTVASFNDGKWHLATAIIDASASNTINLYVDGVSVATTNQTFGNTNNTQSYMIGRYSYYADAYWSGQLGQIQQTRGIKTASQILADFKGGIARRNDSMLHLKFSGPDDATFLKDYSPLQQLVTGINVTKAGDQVRGAYPYYSK